MTVKRKKTWIKIKREDCAIWLYMQIIDWADWETGTIKDWRDQDAADALEMSLRTIREWRKKLEDGIYIKTQQHHQHQVIKITNWTNPREYSGQVYNKAEGGENLQPSIDDGGENLQPSNDHGDIHGDTHDHKNLSPLHSIPHITYHNKNHHISDLPMHEEIDRSLEALLGTMLKDAPDQWKKVMTKASKRMDGRILKLEITDEVLAGEINARTEPMRKGMAMAGWPFAYFEMTTPPPPEDITS